MRTTVKGTEGGWVKGWGIIHEEYAGRVSEKRCFRRHEISFDVWRKMTEKDEMRWWKARGIIRTYTPIGLGVVGYSRRRWGDDLKVIDRWHICKAGTEFEAVDLDPDEVSKK